MIERLQILAMSRMPYRGLLKVIVSLNSAEYKYMLWVTDAKGKKPYLMTNSESNGMTEFENLSSEQQEQLLDEMVKV